MLSRRIPRNLRPLNRCECELGIAAALCRGEQPIGIEIYGSGGRI
jgi:hypothetical protein